MPSARQVLVSFRGVQKTYDGETLVVRNLDLDIYQGEFLTLLGPSGSGKTTCLMLLAGFEFPTGGEIRLDGALLNRVPPHKRNIGMVFQNYALFPHMTVAQNVAYPLSVRKVPRPERAERVQRALDMVRMGGFAARYPGQLSGGQQQRIALARALVFEPRLVLMDEPLGALDKQLREHMQLELKSLHETLGITFVYVTHDQSEALTMSDRVAVFDQGVIQQLDTVSTLYEEPGNAFVARFVGDSIRLTAGVDAVADNRCTITLPHAGPVQAMPVGKLRAGHPATAIIRPERVTLLAPNTGAPAAAGGHVNRIPATVLGMLYFGDHVRVRCQVPGQDECFVKLPLASRLPAGVVEGGAVELAFDDAHLRVFQ